jgi:succinoglycan biosynthesis transport protein ExoP
MSSSRKETMADISHESQGGLLAQVQHYWHVILKWRWTASVFFVAVIAAATIFSFLVPPVFVSKGSIWIEEEANILPFEDVQRISIGTSLLSHARLLQSRSLAAETIDKLKLYENPDFVGKPGKGEKPYDPTDPVFREKLIEEFLKNIDVSFAERTRLVDVRFRSRNPRLAADTLNALFDGYIDMIVSKRYSASEKATEFLNTQIATLRSEIEEREKKLNEYGSEKDILPLSAAEAPMVTRMAEVNRALTEATIDRVNRLTYYNQLKSAPLGQIPDVPENSLIQSLREQYVTLSRQYANRLATVRPEYPEMQRLKSELDSATEALQTETQNLIRNAYNDYEAALRKEQSLQRLLEEQKTQAYKANSNSVVYNSLRIELENKKTLLESLSRRQSETDVSSRLKGLEALNVWIVDKADYPLRPEFPNKKRNVLMGFLLGLAGGIGLALGIEYLNHTVKTSKDVTGSIGISTLGTIPSFENDARPKGPGGEFTRIKSLIWGRSYKKRRKGRRRKRVESFLEPNGDTSLKNNNGRQNEIELIASREPQSIQAESYRSIRTTLLVSSPPGKIKTMLFTSPLAKEGKSSTISNLGITLAESSKRVVIVDSDLRKPKQARIFGLNSTGGPGLSRFLSSHIEPGEIIKPTNVPNLQLISSGPLPVNPIELLTSERMDNLVAYLKRNFDFVLFDTPPILAVSDALAMGPMADAIILVARGGQTPIQALKQAKQKLDAHKLKCLGVILNGVDLLEQEGYYARQYYHYSKPE